MPAPDPTKRPDARGRRLVECPGDIYPVFVTEVVSRIYAGHANSEREQIKELRENLSLDTFCFQSFDSTGALFRNGRSAPEIPSVGCSRPDQEDQVAHSSQPPLKRAGSDRPCPPDARRLRVRSAVPAEERPEFLQGPERSPSEK